MTSRFVPSRGCQNAIGSPGYGALAGAGTGALIGTLILPGVGTILGGIAGAIGGAIGGQHPNAAASPPATPQTPMTVGKSNPPANDNRAQRMAA